MRFLIYGAGVIGSIFAGQLSKAGEDVTVLARGKRLEELLSNGLVLKKAGSSKSETIQLKAINTLSEGDIYDYILVIMQKNQVSEVLPILRANHSKNLVFVVNNALGYKEWVEAVGEERLMIGFPAAGGGRAEGEVSYFIMRSLLSIIQMTTFGEYSGEKTERLMRLVNIMTKAGIPSTWSSNMDAWQKSHVSLVTAIANLLYQFDGNNYEASKHYNDIRICVQAIKEGLSVIKALGYPVTPIIMNQYFLPTPMVSLMMKCILNTKFAETAMAKHTVAAKEELLCLQGELDKLISSSGLKTPNIDKLKVFLYHNDSIGTVKH